MPLRFTSSGRTDDARAKEGPFGVYGNAPAVLESLWKTLEATPAPAK